MQDCDAWKLADTEARLDFAGLRATVDLNRPALGLTEITYREAPIVSRALLGMVIGEPSAALTIADAYIRHADLVVTYAETPDVPFRVQVYWRAAQTTQQCPAIDLQVSVQTSLLESNPRIKACTSLDASAILRMADEPQSGFLPFEPDPDDECPSGPESHNQCVLVRAAHERLSYAEMIQPADNCGSLLSVGGTLGNPVISANVRHYLFQSSLEKGVILRARLRGVFLPAEHDTELAAEAYRQFLAAPLPLTT